MRTLKYAILGLLDQQPMSGYDLSAQFGEALNEFWSAKHSQIYPELRHLLEEGLIECHVEISGKVLERKVYSLTEAGRQDFLAWLTTKDDIAPTPKDIFRLRMFFSSRLTSSQRAELIEHELSQHELRLSKLKQKLDSMESVPAENDPAFGDRLVLRGAVLREEASCRWLNECLALCTKET